jgi:hypothetical protein
MLADVTIAFTAQGHAFNTFPKMGDTWLPRDLFEKQPFLSNFFENTATVQVSRPCTPLRLDACLAVFHPQVDSVFLQVWSFEFAPFLTVAVAVLVAFKD